MIGVKFNECDPFLLQLSFTDCQLNFSSFYQLKTPKTKFVNCNLQEADFTESILSNSIFDNCDLKRANFSRTNIEKSDFETSFNFEINPEENKIKGAKFSRSSIDGLLVKFGIIIK
mgnify:CR=1 FL=1